MSSRIFLKEIVIAEKYLRSFIAREMKGASHSIRIYQEFVSKTDANGLVIEKPGRCRLATSRGEEVSRIEKGHYMIDTLQAEVYSEDPGAF